jgi:hypothetical protein
LRGADLVLLIGGENVNDTIHGLGGALGVQCAKDQVTGAGGGQRQFDGLQVPHFPHQDDVRVFAQGAFEGRRKGTRVDAHLAVVDQRALALVHELDRVLDGEDVVFAVLVRVINHGRQRGGLARAGRPGHQHHAFVQHGQFLEDGRQRGVEFLEILERKDFGRDLPEHGRHTVLLVEKVGADPGNAGNLVAKVNVAGLLVHLHLVLGSDLVEHRLEDVAFKGWVVHPMELAANAQDRGIARRKVEVGGQRVCMKVR